ncbi:MAG: DUF3887 domain-containing protein [Roseburia sp.]
MTAEKYVKQIVKKIACSSKKKKDIKKQLLAEMEDRSQAGESLTEIMAEMGNVQEIADSFNESISAEEKKRYKVQKILKIVITIILALVILGALLVWALPKQNDIKDSQVFTQDEVESTLLRTIDLLDQGDYDTLQSMGTHEMESTFNVYTMENAKSQISENWGTRTSIGNIYMAEITQMNRHFAVCQVNASYENVSVVYTITFDENMKIAGLYFR